MPARRRERIGCGCQTACAAWPSIALVDWGAMTRMRRKRRDRFNSRPADHTRDVVARIASTSRSTRRNIACYGHSSCPRMSHTRESAESIADEMVYAALAELSDCDTERSFLCGCRIASATSPLGHVNSAVSHRRSRRPIARRFVCCRDWSLDCQGRSDTDVDRSWWDIVRVTQA